MIGRQRGAAWSLALVLVGAHPAAARPVGPEPAEAPSVAAREASAELQVSSPQQERRGDTIVARGFVDIRYRGQVLQADQVELNTKTRDLVATGNVVLQQGEDRIAGDRLEYNLDTRLGRLESIWGYSGREVYFSAREAEKTGPERYELRGATVTSCSQPRPQWRLRASSGVFQVDRYVRLWNARLEVLGVPALYMPFFQYPARRDRSTGFLFPAFGEHSRRGFYLGNAFFWAIGRSYDATVTHEWYADQTQRVLGEVRYMPSRDASGIFSSQHLFEEGSLDDVGAQYRLTHNQRIGRTFRAGAAIDYATDSRLDRQYSRDVFRISQRRRQSSAFLERNWSRYSLRAKGDHIVAFSGDAEAETESRQYRLPEVAFDLRDTRVLGPLHAALASSGTYFGTRPSGSLATTNWSRVDLAPRLSMPLHPFPWLELRPSGTYRATYWTSSREPGALSSDLVEEGFLRHFGTVEAEVLGPVFQRVFLTPSSSYSEKFKHIIEPEVGWSFAQDGDPEGRSPTIDGIDFAGRREEHFLRFTLRNRLLAKRALGEGAVPTPHEMILFELTTGYDLQAPSGDELQPLFGNLRFVPGRDFLATYRFRFDLEDRFFSQHSVQADWRRGISSLHLNYSRSSTTSAVTGQEVTAGVLTELFRGKVALGSGFGYDFVREEIRDLRFDLTYRTQCCGFGASYRSLSYGSRDDEELRFSVSLKNIGTVFDYTTGESGF